MEYEASCATSAKGGRRTGQTEPPPLGAPALGNQSQAGHAQEPLDLVGVAESRIDAARVRTPRRRRRATRPTGQQQGQALAGREGCSGTSARSTIEIGDVMRSPEIWVSLRRVRSDV